ncbi:2-iminoacetate synthase ThiH [bacterium endosymbiont of Pedicinus badii]|uniref:2-iminoacetate synthase ThiH n=1 Tax=bacterium endosymbiont of Pedicinus badii TaxID=1719126 RepID=UPI0009B99C8C|nr:2-iminoacetate synthase ThiH [bacterium endosymbiont of Pedicinus badii]OQM34039.1 thiamine biosynthesis protein ThiH [bacterium endosymbiont of Pedicinus badii]
MESFFEIWKNLSWKKIDSSINKKTEKDVQKAIFSGRPNFEDMLALLSPIALKYIKFLIKKSREITKKKFGNNIQIFLPMYVSNFCTNDCSYCGFSSKNKIRRKFLDTKEIEKECKKIKSLGIKNILVVSGENNRIVGIEYFLNTIKIVKKYFSMILFEVQPLSVKEYSVLQKNGLDGILLYQETYNYTDYNKHHIKGKKKDFFWRISAPERIGQSNISKIGLGILSGLSKYWRVDYYFLYLHIMYLRKKFWKCEYSISFPRIRPFFYSKNKKKFLGISDLELIQVICSFRILFPEIEINLSTRESKKFRNFMIPVCINNISVNSKTYPGGYTKKKKELEQFSIQDNRNINQIMKYLQSKDLQIVFKDWDSHFGR